MTELIGLPAVQLAELVRRGEISPVEIVEAHLESAARVQAKLNCFASLDEAGARTQARALEAAIQRREQPGPLAGVPLTIKSSVFVAGWKCETGSALRRNYVSREDAPLVCRLKGAGAILIGNTNVPEFLMAYESRNTLYGAVSNPWDVSYSAGGSSGGEAASIASGCSAGGVGSDGGGSIRVPAHFCGICGLKPTPGRIPITGHFPEGVGAFAWLGVVGPMARTVADLRALFEVMAGTDAGDARSAPVPLRQKRHAGMRSIRIGVLESDALGAVTPETRSAVEQAARGLADHGFAVEHLRLTGLDRAIELWWFFFGRSIAHLLRGSTLGHEKELSPMLREYLEVTGQESALKLDDFLAACAERDVLRGDILRAMDATPILLSAVSAGPAFRHGEGTWHPGTAASYREVMRHSQWLNLTGFPGATVPVSSSAEGMPIGVQVIGRPYEEELVLDVAEQIEESCGGWRRPPVL